MLTEFYRYEIVTHYDELPKTQLYKFPVLRETPKGYWIGGAGYGRNRWVAKVGKKRFAYETVELAKKSFRIRKEIQLRHLENKIIEVARGLDYFVEKIENVS